MESARNIGLTKRVAVIGNHFPRQCGIATFTSDLIEAVSSRFLNLDCFALAMNDKREGYPYPAQVRYVIQADELASYRRAATYLNSRSVDVVSLQHEYGIFGGEAGIHILTLLRDLKMPIVTTLHTILSKPNREQYEVMAELTQLSTRFIVMSRKGAQILHEVHGVDNAKIDIIHHGIPNVPLATPEHFKECFQLAGRSVLLTFGLLSPDKGIENVIEAMPAILARFPDAVYVVLGATHPHIILNEGERYRDKLEALVDQLGVRENVLFHNRFVSVEELTQFLRAADIYITPYLKPEQITSGTLAYAVGSGKAVISTPYSYAEELLAEGRGILVPWRDPQAIAREVIGLLGNPLQRSELQRKALEYGREMVWSTVADRYMDTFQRAHLENAEREFTSQLATVVDSLPLKLLTPLPLELPAIDLKHLRMMTDDTGLLQHATYNVPNYDEGYCLDDNVRALLLVTHLESTEEKESVDLSHLATRYLAFVKYAFHAETGRFRNFLSYERHWLEDQGSEDSHGRALWALGTVAGRSGNLSRQHLANYLFHAALPVVAEFTSPRAWAYTLLGLDEALTSSSESTSVTLRDLLAKRLLLQFQANRSADWHWLEDSVTYCNARLPQALITSGDRMEREDMLQVGLESLEWLVSIQSSKRGWFVPIGSNGFLLRGGASAPFDQQPVEACGMVSACHEAFRVTGDIKWLLEARQVFDWFLGQNDLLLSLYDPLSGGCYDGLHPDRLNENQGAESTLSFLQSLLDMQLSVTKHGKHQPSLAPQISTLYRKTRLTKNLV